MYALDTKQTFMGNEDGERLKEIHLLVENKTDEFKALYKDHIGRTTPEGKPTFGGFKNSKTMVNKKALTNIEKHFPETDFIISMRHPVFFSIII